MTKQTKTDTRTRFDDQRGIRCPKAYFTGTIADAPLDWRLTWSKVRAKHRERRCASRWSVWFYHPGDYRSFRRHLCAARDWTSAPAGRRWTTRLCQPGRLLTNSFSSRDGWATFSHGYAQIASPARSAAGLRGFSATDYDARSRWQSPARAWDG